VQYVWWVPVRNRPDLQPVYYLVFFTRHPDGVWVFNGALARANRVWRRHVAPAPPPSEGMLFEIDDPFDEAEARFRRAAQDRFKINVQRRLGEIGAFVLGRELVVLLDDQIEGQVGEPEMRAALKELHDEGKIPTKIVGVRKLHRLVVQPSGDTS
jgi:hypothetical protein